GDLALGDRREDGAEGSWHAVGSLLSPRPEVGTDAVRVQHVGRDTSDVGEPPADGSAFGLPQPLRALVDVAPEPLGITARSVYGRSLHRWPSGWRPVATAVRVPDAAGEEVERVADVASLARDDEVDGGAT